MLESNSRGVLSKPNLARLERKWEKHKLYRPVQDTNSSAQQDAMILSVFEQLSNQVTNGNQFNKDNLIANESLSAELKRYKERVKLLEERQNVDLSTREKLIMDDIIREKNAQFADLNTNLITYLKRGKESANNENLVEFDELIQCVRKIRYFRGNPVKEFIKMALGGTDPADSQIIPHVELEKTLEKQTKENSDLLMKVDNLENAFADEVKRATMGKLTAFDKDNCVFRSKVDDSKAEKDQFLKEINHLRAKFRNLKGKFVETKFDKSLILGKPPQLSKSWFTPKVVVQKDLSKPVTTQSLPRNKKDQLLKRIASLESKLASQDIRSCQKEYHELRTSYNALKVKFDSLNRTKRKTNVSKSSKPKVSVSEKIHTGEFSKPFSKRVSQFTTYSLQKDRKFSKKSQSFKTHAPQKVFKTSASNAKNQVLETPNSRFTPVKQVWRLSKKTQTFETPNSQVVFKTNALKDKNQVFVTPHSRFTPVKQVWRLICEKSHILIISKMALK
ncbi:hypothetical protein Tco_0514240 [Tanacetum coccineum]